jgi:hypothetical protein
MSGRLKSYYAIDANVSDSTPFCGVTKLRQDDIKSANIFIFSFRKRL